jgi:hypothetical protein
LGAVLRDELTHDRVAACEALGGDLAAQHGGLEAALVDAFYQVRLERIEQAGSRFLPDEHLVPGLRMGVSGHGAVAPAQVAGAPTAPPRVSRAMCAASAGTPAGSSSATPLR